MTDNERTTPDPARAIYGTITVGALLAAESAQRETYLETVAAVAIAMVLYWLAHAYANLTGDRIRDAEPLTLHRAGNVLVHELAILIGASVPLLAVLVCWVAGTRLSTAVSAGVWTSALVIVAIEIVTAIRTELKGRELIGQVALGVILGVLVIVLRAVLH